MKIRRINNLGPQMKNILLLTIALLPAVSSAASIDAYSEVGKSSVSALSVDGSLIFLNGSSVSKVRSDIENNVEKEVYVTDKNCYVEVSLFKMGEFETRLISGSQDGDCERFDGKNYMYSFD